MWVGWVRWGRLSAQVRAWLDRVTWVAARGAVDAVRYRPRHLDLVVVACGASQPEVSPSVARWLVETRAQPAVVRASRLPHAAVRAIARQAARCFGPTGSALVRFFSGALAAAADAARGPAPLDSRVNGPGRAMHAVFDLLYAGGRSEWRESGRQIVDIGLGAGLSFGRATIGFIGPSGKKQFGAIGEPVNLAAFLGSEASSGTSLVDCASFRRAGGLPPPGKVVLLRSRKRHQRVETLRLYPDALYQGPRGPGGACGP